jgi:hypothetical protein
LGIWLTVPWAAWADRHRSPVSLENHQPYFPYAPAFATFAACGPLGP